MVDNTLALQVRPFQMPDLGQIYGNIQNIQMNRMRMAEAQEMAQERNALRGLLSSGIDPYSAEGLAQVRRTAPMLASQFEQAAGQRAVQQAQVRRYNAQADADRFKLYRGQLGGVNSQDAWTNWRSSVVQEFPQFAASIPERFSPQAREEVAGGADLLIQRATAAAAAAAARPPAPSAREQRIADTMTTFGVDRATALGIVDNIIAVVPGSAGEPPTLLNRLTNELITPRMGAARLEGPAIDLRRPQAAAPAAPTNMMLPGATATVPTAPTNMMLPGATGAPAPTSVEDLYAGRRLRQVEQAGQTAEAQARGQAIVRREERPARVQEAGETAEAQARAQAVVRGEERPARVQEAGETTGAQETARLAARSEAERRQEQEQLNRAISELERISAPGGLLERSTGGGLNAIVDRFFDFFNAPTSGAVAIGSLQPIADVVLKMVPRFEGPQSDRDTQSYREAAGRLADPTVPNETRLAAAREILRLFRARQNQFEHISTTGTSAPAGTPRPSGSAQPARTGQRPAPPSVGDVVDGYRFRGGDPSNPRNWERQ